MHECIQIPATGLETKSLMTVRELLAAKPAIEVVSIEPDATIREAARKLSMQRIGVLVVIDGTGALVGIFSERDLVRTIPKSGGGFLEDPVSSVMTLNVITCSPQHSASDVLSLMKSNHIRHVPVVQDGQLTGMISMRDLSRAYEELAIEANTDSLTGLANRRHFFELLDNELLRARRFGHPLSVAIIDVDHFKRINDTFGHEAGDNVLKSLAVQLQRQLRTIDRVGRIGGEEFAILFPETDIAGAKLACDRLLTSIRSAAIDVLDAHVTITVSIGLTSANEDLHDPLSLLRRADRLLYDAKSHGRDRLETDEPQILRYKYEFGEAAGQMRSTA